MGSLIRRENGIYYGVFSCRGKRVWRSTFSRCREEAEGRFKLMALEYTSWDKLQLSVFKNEMLRLLTGSLSAETVKIYGRCLKKLEQQLGDVSLNRITPFLCETFKARRLREVAPVTVNLETRTLKAIFNRAKRLRMVETNPFDSVDTVRIPEREPQFLRPKEFRKLISIIDDPLIQSIVLFAIATSMRLGEIMNLLWRDVDFDESSVHIRSRSDFVVKGGRRRKVSLNRLALQVLQGMPVRSEFVFARDNGNRLHWRTVSQKFKRYSRAAGLAEEIHFHSLRHTAATWLVQEKVPIVFVKEILGHTSLKTTMIYAHAPPEYLSESLSVIDRILINPTNKIKEHT